MIYLWVRWKNLVMVTWDSVWVVCCSSSHKRSTNKNEAFENLGFIRCKFLRRECSLQRIMGQKRRLVFAVRSFHLFTFIIYGIYWKYWFHTKKFEILFLLKSCFLPIKSHKTWKKAIKKIPSVTRSRRHRRRRRWQKFVPRLQPRP
jgi:hypothetical protein